MKDIAMNAKNYHSIDFSQGEFESIIALVNDYFQGLQHADEERLRTIFHPGAFLKAPNLRRSLEQWLEVMATRPIPAEQGQVNNFKLLSIEVTKDQAVVKLDCPLFDHAYIDFLSLLKEDGRWLIINKMYTDMKDPIEAL